MTRVLASMQVKQCKAAHVFKQTEVNLENQMSKCSSDPYLPYLLKRLF